MRTEHVEDLLFTGSPEVVTWPNIRRTNEFTQRIAGGLNRGNASSQHFGKILPPLSAHATYGFLNGY